MKYVPKCQEKWKKYCEHNELGQIHDNYRENRQHSIRRTNFVEFVL
jgi:hypothetical protein